MGVGRNKRGNLTELVMSPMFVVIIILTLVFLPLLKYATSVGKSSYFERQFCTKDLGLMVSALQAAPNDVTLTYDNVRNVNVTLNKDYVEAYGYDVDPKQSPSKVSRFHIFSSTLNIVEAMLSPTLLIDEKGNVNVLPYSIYLKKDSESISASTSNGFLTIIPKKDVIDNAVDTIVSVLFEQKKIYIDVADGNGKNNMDVDADVFGESVCKNVISGTSFSSVPTCNDKNIASLNDRIKLSEASDFVVIIYVNGKSNSALKIYFYDGTGESVEKSRIVSDKMVKVFGENGLTLTKDDISHLDSNDEIKQILKSDKPGVVVEIGNVEELNNNDINTIGGMIKTALVGVSK